MNEITLFQSAEFGQIRTTEINGTPYFVGKDVAEALGYSNTKDAIAKHVDDEDKRLLQRSDFATLENHIPKEVLPVNFVRADIPNRGLTIINESGVYALVFGSKLPTAKKFKHWVTSEILPTIRKHGAYMTEQTLEQALTSPDFLIKLATQLKTEQEKNRELESTVKKQGELMERARPLVCFANSVKTANTSILIGELAKILKQNGVNIGQNRLFAWLRENGYLVSRKGSDYNMPTQKSMELGLFEIKETTINHSDGHISISKTPKISGKGQVYFVNKFLKPIDLQ